MIRFGGQNAGGGLLINGIFGRLREKPGELLIVNRPRLVQKSQKSVDLPRGQGVDNLVQPVQLTHGS